MADFDVQVVEGATLKPWKDPIGPGGQPSRIRPHPGRPQLYWEGHANVDVLLWATIAGGALPDSGLGGRLFTPFMAEGIGPPHFSNPMAGWSSVVLFHPLSAGHYCIGIRRLDGGAVLVHLDLGAAV